METFETIIILTDKITEETYENASYHFKNMIKGLSGTKIMTERLGKKKLAYKIHNCEYGYFLVYTYQATSRMITTKLEPALRQDDNVMKYITVASEKDYTPDPDDPEEEVNNRK